MNKKHFLIIFTLAAVLRIFDLWTAPLWYDENFTLLLARLPFTRMLSATAGDVHPPLWYLIEWTLYRLPNLPPWAIRIPALLFSLAALWAFWRVLLALHIDALDPRVGTAALLLTAVLPMQLWFAQEGRMYSLLEFLALVGLLTVFERRWSWMTVVIVAMLYTHNYGIFYAAALGLVAMIRDRRDLVPLIWSAQAAILAWLPWLFVLTNQMQSISGNYWIMRLDLGQVVLQVEKLFWNVAIPGEVTFAAVVVTMLALLVGSAYAITRRPANWQIVIVMAWGPLAMAAIASALWQPVILYRALIGSSPFLYLLVCWPLSLLFDGPRLRLAPALYVTALALPFILAGIVGTYKYTPLQKGGDEMNRALAIIRAEWQPGDVLYHLDDGSLVNWLPYSSDLAQYKMPECEHTLGALTSQTRAALGVDEKPLDQIDYKRVWLAAPLSPLHPQCYIEIRDALLAQAQPVLVIDDNEYITSGVWLLERK